MNLVTDLIILQVSVQQLFKKRDSEFWEIVLNNLEKLLRTPVLQSTFGQLLLIVREAETYQK